MASELFTTVPEGVIFEEFRKALEKMARELNGKRTSSGTQEGLATVRVSPLLVDPRDRSVSLLIHFSDCDNEAPRLVRKEMKRMSKIGRRRLRRWQNEQGRVFWFDPYRA